MPRKSPPPHTNAQISSAEDGATGRITESVLTWLRATYHFHTFCYRDPRSAFSSALGIPVISPTAIVLGIASTLFGFGEADLAREFMKQAHLCGVAVDPPEGAIFFRAFHQLRRYVSTINKGKKESKKIHRAGFTDINQGTKEYALFDGPITLFVGVPTRFVEPVKLALLNRDHIGAHDSMCALIGNVEECQEPKHVLYLPPETWQTQLPRETSVTILTLARFAKPLTAPTVGHHWWMAGGEDTELVAYMIKGKFVGTTHGRIYLKES